MPRSVSSPAIAGLEFLTGFIPFFFFHQRTDHSGNTTRRNDNEEGQNGSKDKPPISRERHNLVLKEDIDQTSKHGP